MVATSPAPAGDLRAKVVVRHLPPGLAADGFRSVVASWVVKADFFRYVQGKQSAKELVHSRAYLRFTDPQDVPLFTQQLHGHVFVTERGTQYRCSVEYAPYQKVPRARTKKDPREGTLEKDADYLAFLERLQAGPTLLPSAETQLTSKDGETSAGAPVVTALMQFLAEKRLQPKVAQTSAGAAGRERKSSKAEQAPRQQGGKATKAAAAAAAAAAAVAAAGKRGPAGGKDLPTTVGVAGKGTKQKQGHVAEAAEHQAPKLLKPAKGKGAASAPTAEPGSAQGAGQAGPAAAPAKDAKAASRGDKRTGKQHGGQQGGQQPHEAQPAATPKKLLKKPPGGATAGDASAAPAAAAPQPAATQQQAQQQGQQQQQRKGSSGRKQREAPASAPAATGAGAPSEGKRILARKPPAGQQAEQPASLAQQPAGARDTVAPATAGERKGVRRQQQQGQGGAAGAAGTDVGTSSQPAVEGPQQSQQQQPQQRPSRRTRPGWGGVYQPKRVGRLLGEEGDEGT